MTDQPDPKVIEEAVRNALNPLVLYEPGTDQKRWVTQADVDRGQCALWALAEIRAIVERERERAVK